MPTLSKKDIEKIREIIEYIPKNKLRHVLLDLAQGKVDVLREALDKAHPNETEENSAKIQFFSGLCKTKFADTLKYFATIAKKKIFDAQQEKEKSSWHKTYTLLLKALTKFNKIIELPTLHIAYEQTEEEPQKKYSYRLMLNDTDVLEERELGFYIVENRIIAKLQGKYDFLMPESDEICNIIIEANKREGTKSFTIEEIRLLSQSTLLSSHIQKKQIKEKLKLAVTDLAENCCATLHESWHKEEWGEFIGLSIGPIVPQKNDQEQKKTVEPEVYEDRDTATIQLYLRNQPISAEYQSSDGGKHTIPVALCNLEAQYNPKSPKRTITISKLTFTLTKKAEEDKEASAPAIQLEQPPKPRRVYKSHKFFSTPETSLAIFFAEVPLEPNSDTKENPEKESPEFVPTYKHKQDPTTFYSAIVSNLIDVTKNRDDKKHETIDTFTATLPETPAAFLSIFEKISESTAGFDRYLMSSSCNDGWVMDMMGMWNQKRSAYIFTPDSMFYFNGNEVVKIAIDKNEFLKLKEKLGINEPIREENKAELSVDQLSLIASISGHAPTAPTDKINFLLTTIGNDKLGTFTNKLLKNKKLWQTLQQLPLNSDNALRITYVIAENLEEALKQQDKGKKNKKAIANLKQALKYLRKNKNFTNPIVNSIKSIDDLKKILRKDPYGIFLPVLFSSKQIAKIKENSDPGLWIKLRKPLEENLSAAEKSLRESKISESSRESESRGFRTQENSWLDKYADDKAPKSSWLDKHAIRNIVPILYNHFQNPDKTKLKWIDRHPSFSYSLRPLIGFFRTLWQTLISGNKKASCVIDGSCETKGKILIGAMPPFEKLSNLVRELAGENEEMKEKGKDVTEKKIILISYQAPEETYTRDGNPLDDAISGSTNISIGKIDEATYNVERKSRPLFDHSGIETTTGEPVDPRKVMDWLNEDAKDYEDGAIIRINCKSGIERSNVMTALLCSRVKDMPLFEAFKLVNEKRPSTLPFNKLNPKLQQLAINTYFLMLKENPACLEKFLQQSPEVIGKYIAAFLQANLNLKNAKAQNWDELSKHIKSIDINISEAFLTVMTAINEYKLWLVPEMENEEATIQYIAEHQPKEPNIIPIVKLRKSSGFSVDYYVYGQDKKLHSIRGYDCITSAYPPLDNPPPSDEPLLLTKKAVAKEDDAIYKNIMLAGGYAQLSMIEKGYAMPPQAQMALDYYCDNEQQKILVKALYLIPKPPANIEVITAAVANLKKLLPPSGKCDAATRSINMAIEYVSINECNRALTSSLTSVKSTWTFHRPMYIFTPNEISYSDGKTSTTKVISTEELSALKIKLAINDSAMRNMALSMKQQQDIISIISCTRALRELRAAITNAATSVTQSAPPEALSRQLSPLAAQESSTADILGQINSSTSQPLGETKKLHENSYAKLNPWRVTCHCEHRKIAVVESSCPADSLNQQVQQPVAT